MSYFNRKNYVFREIKRFEFYVNGLGFWNPFQSNYKGFQVVWTEKHEENKYNLCWLSFLLDERIFYSNTFPVLKGWWTEQFWLGFVFFSSGNFPIKAVTWGLLTCDEIIIEPNKNEISER